MDLLLRDKTALVCAATRGLGLAIAEGLASEGCSLFICARDADAVTDTAQRLARTHGTMVRSMAIDLTMSDTIPTLLQRCRDEMGAIDILVNNIGGPSPTSAVATKPEEWRDGFERLFMSAALLSQGVIPDMKKRQFGRIITVTSLSVVEPIDNLVVSTSMRAAVTTFNKTLASEVAKDGITVNTVMPGVIHTQRIEQLRHAKAARDGTTFAAEMAKTSGMIPVGRLGQPTELADLVTFLASPRASYITATNIPVDGGQRRGW